MLISLKFFQKSTNFCTKFPNFYIKIPLIFHKFSSKFCQNSLKISWFSRIKLKATMMSVNVKCHHSSPPSKKNLIKFSYKLIAFCRKRSCSKMIRYLRSGLTDDAFIDRPPSHPFFPQEEFTYALHPPPPPPKRYIFIFFYAS